jgi:hypothetical protein
MGADSGFQPSGPRLSVVPACYGCKTRCGRALLGADPPRIIASVGEGSQRAGRRIRREQGCAAMAATGSDVVCARSRSRRLVLPQSRGPSRPRATDRVLRGAQRDLPCAARVLLLGRLPAAAADLAAGGVRTLPGTRLRGSVFVRVPHGAILLPVMAESAGVIMLRFMLVHFSAAKGKVARRLSRVPLRTGTGRLVNARICLMRIRGSSQPTVTGCAAPTMSLCAGS